MNFDNPPKFVRVTTDLKTGKTMDYRMRRTLPTKLDFHFFTRGSWHLLDSKNSFSREQLDGLITQAKASLKSNYNKHVYRGPYWVVTDTAGIVVVDWKSHAQNP
jgi:hypothetical protein